MTSILNLAGRILPRACLAISLFSIICSCAPKSVRPPLPPGDIPVPPPVSQEDEQFGHEVLGGLSQKYELDYDHPRRSEVDEIVNRIAQAIGASNQPWHVHVFKAGSVKNAAATRGNHIFVWTGIINATTSEDELSAILAHEMAHVLLRHTEPTERESWAKVVVEGVAIAAAVGSSIATGGAYGADILVDVATALTKEIGQGILVNPYAREKEHEADELGLVLMKKAGYPPQAAIDFWSRALNDPAFTASISFFSTHPPARDRLERLQTIVNAMYGISGTPISTPLSAPSVTPTPVVYPTSPTGPLGAANSNAQPVPSYPIPTVTLDPDDSFDVRAK